MPPKIATSAEDNFLRVAFSRLFLLFPQKQSKCPEFPETCPPVVATRHLAGAACSWKSAALRGWGSAVARKEPKWTSMPACGLWAQGHIQRLPGTLKRVQDARSTEKYCCKSSESINVLMHHSQQSLPIPQWSLRIGDDNGQRFSNSARAPCQPSRRASVASGAPKW